MTRRSDKELTQIVYDGLNRALDYSNTNLTEMRRKAWDRYLGRPRGDELPGRSRMVDTTIRDAHHALLATIMPTYATDSVIELEPQGPDDEDQAAAESAALNNLFTEDQEGYETLRDAVSDALLFRNGVIKVWVSEAEERSTQRFEGAQVGLVRAALQQQGLEVESISAEGGVVTATTVERFDELQLKAIEPSYFYVDPNQENQNLQDADFIAERWIAHRWELIELGVPRGKVAKLTELSDAGVTSRIPSTDVQARFDSNQATLVRHSTELDQRVEVFWVHMRVDGERWRFLVGGDNLLLLKEPVDFYPYASGSGWPVPHRWSGLGLYDLLVQTEDARTNAKRQLNDNLNFANNQRPIADPTTTEWEDVVTGAPGRGIRSRDPASVGWMPFTDIASNSLAYLSYLDDVVSKQAGAALDMASADLQSIKDVSGISAEMQLGPAEQMAAQISRNLAETLVRNTFLLMHRSLRELYDGTLMFHRAGEWQETNPGEWQPRNRINVTVGLSPAERRRRKATLEQVLNYQLQFVAGGAANIATNYSQVHNALRDWLHAAEVDGGQAYFLDPDGPESQQAQQAAAQQGQQDGEVQAQMAAMQVQIEQQAQQLEKYKHDTDLKFKYDELAQKGEIAEAELVADGIKASISGTGAGAETAAKRNGAAGGNSG